MPAGSDPSHHPLGLDAIKGFAAVPPDLLDEKDKAEQAALRSEQLRAAVAHRREMDELRRASYRQDTGERKAYATKIFWLVAVWLGLMFVLLVLSGFKQFSAQVGSVGTPVIIGSHFELSDKVLIALVTGTTVDVIGLFAVVVSYLFFRPKRKPSRKLVDRATAVDDHRRGRSDQH